MYDNEFSVCFLLVLESIHLRKQDKCMNFMVPPQLHGEIRGSAPSSPTRQILHSWFSGRLSVGRKVLTIFASVSSSYPHTSLTRYLTLPSFTTSPVLSLKPLLSDLALLQSITSHISVPWPVVILNPLCDLSTERKGEVEEEGV